MAASAQSAVSSGTASPWVIDHAGQVALRGAVHDIANSLAGIAQVVQVLERRADLPASTQELVALSEESVSKALDQIAALKALYASWAAIDSATATDTPIETLPPRAIVLLETLRRQLRANDGDHSSADWRIATDVQSGIRAALALSPEAARLRPELDPGWCQELAQLRGTITRVPRAEGEWMYVDFERLATPAVGRSE